MLADAQTREILNMQREKQTRDREADTNRRIKFKAKLIRKLQQQRPFAKSRGGDEVKKSKKITKKRNTALNKKTLRLGSLLKT